MLYRFNFFSAKIENENKCKSFPDSLLLSILWATLLCIHLDHIVIFQIQTFRSVLTVDFPRTKKKTIGRGKPHLEAVRLLKLSHFRGLSNSVVNFIWILPHHFDFYHIIVLTVCPLEWTIRLMHLKILRPHFDRASVETKFAFVQNILKAWFWQHGRKQVLATSYTRG